MAVSHVLWTTGLVLPLPEIADAAHAVGATVLVDGAQSGGAIPARHGGDGRGLLRPVSGQKWLLGPQGTGALWVHPRSHDRLRPATPSYFTYADGQVGRLRPGAARFDAGSIDTTVLAGFAAAMEWVEGLPGGRAAWLELGRRARPPAARRRLAEVPGVRGARPRRAVQRPDRPAPRRPRVRSTPSPTWRERDVLVRPIPDTPFVRVSVGAWTDDSGP